MNFLIFIFCVFLGILIFALIYAAFGRWTSWYVIIPNSMDISMLMNEFKNYCYEKKLPFKSKGEKVISVKNSFFSFQKDFSKLEFGDNVIFLKEFNSLNDVMFSIFISRLTTFEKHLVVPLERHISKINFQETLDFMITKILTLQGGKL